MAKRKDTTTSGQAMPRPATSGSSDTSGTDTVEQRLVSFAEQLGRIAGTVQAKADGWLDRQTLNDQLTRIRDGAADLLDHLGSGMAPIAAVPAKKEKTTARRAAGMGRSGGKVGAPGKTHRKPPPSARGSKHSDEMIPKGNAARRMRHSRRG
jgi:hypothetical protein